MSNHFVRVGYMTYIILDSEFGVTNRAGMKAKNRSLLKACVLDPTRKLTSKIHDSSITSIIFIDELRLLVTGADDGQVKTVSIESLSIEKVFEGHVQHESHRHKRQGLLLLAWSSSLRLVISSYQKKVMIWNPATLQIIHSFQEFLSSIVDLSVSERLSKVTHSLCIIYQHNISVYRAS